MVSHAARLVMYSTSWILLLSAALLLLPPQPRASSRCEGAGICYIRAGATGRGTGTNWTDAYTGFGAAAGQVDPARMQRGAVYWIAAGDYGGVAFTTPDSGSSVIALQGAPASSHGPALDWNPGYAGQALFGPSSITTDHWIFNGQTRNTDWRSGYTLKFVNLRDPQGFAVALGTYLGGVHHVAFKYVEMQGTGLTGGAFPHNTTADRCTVDNCGQWMDGNIKEVQPCGNLYFGYGYFHHTGNSQFWFNSTGPRGQISRDLTWEYNWISTNHTGQNGQHDEAFALLANQAVIRYNVFQNIAGSGIIVDSSAARPALSNWFIYGNLFFNDPSYLALGQKYWLNTVDQGIVVLGDGDGTPQTEALSGTFLFANNTMANFNPPGASCLETYSTLPIAGTSMIHGNPQVIIQNNLWFRSSCVHGNYTPVCKYLSGNCKQDYNASVAGGVPSSMNWRTQDQPAAHDYNVPGNADPFTNSRGTALEDYRIAHPALFLEHTGTTLSDFFTADMLGTLRDARSAWGFGALQGNVPGQQAQRRADPEARAPRSTAPR